MEKKKTGSWVRILRVVIWGIVLLAWAVGVSVLGAGSSSKAMAEGTDKVLTGWGVALVVIALLLLVWNFVWGMKRWAEKWYARKWRVVGGVVRTIWATVWRGVVFGAIIVFAMMVIAPKVTSGIRKTVLAKEENEWLTGQIQVEEDFRQGNISPDEYLRYTLAVAFGTEEVPKRYQTDQVEMMPDIAGIVEEYGEQLSKGTLEMALDVVYSANIEVGLDASGNVAKGKEDLIGKTLDLILGAKQVWAYTEKATTLNKAVLSEKGNFIVYYTDTGEDAIADEQARELAGMMERIITNYQEKLGLEYSFTFHDLSKKNAQAMEEVLEANGIEKEAYKTAMAVYVANPFSEETSVLAFYSGEHLAEWGNTILTSLGSLFGVDEARWTKSVAGVPNITILASNAGDPSLELVTAHELGHHYQNLHCQADLGKMCPTGEFMSEGGANWLAINAVEEQPEVNAVQGHHDVYIQNGTCYKADEIVSKPPKEDACHESGSFEGYPAIAFLQNYYEVVDGAVEKMMDALLVEESLVYLREQATGEEFREVMRKLSQRNLTNEYEMSALQASKTVKGVDLSCGSMMSCSVEFPLRPTAVKYVYLATEEYDRVRVKVTGTTEDVISILGRNDQGKWEVITDGIEEMEYVVEKTGKYEAIAFAVGNASVIEAGTFTIEMVVEEIAEMIEEEDEEVSGEEVDGCTVVDFQGLMDDFLSIGRSTFELLEGMGAETGDMGEFEQGVTEAKQSMSGKRLMVCELRMRRGVSMDKVEQIAREMMWVSYRVFAMKNSGIETRIIAGVDQMRTQGEIVLLGEEEGKVYMLEIRVEEE